MVQSWQKAFQRLYGGKEWNMKIKYIKNTNLKLVLFTCICYWLKEVFAWTERKVWLLVQNCPSTGCWCCGSINSIGVYSSWNKYWRGHQFSFVKVPFGHYYSFLLNNCTCWFQRVQTRYTHLVSSILLPFYWLCISDVLIQLHDFI